MGTCFAVMLSGHKLADAVIEAKNCTLLFLPVAT